MLYFLLLWSEIEPSSHRLPAINLHLARTYFLLGDNASSQEYYARANDPSISFTADDYIRLAEIKMMDGEDAEADKFKKEAELIDKKKIKAGLESKYLKFVGEGIEKSFEPIPVNSFLQTAKFQ